MAGYGDMDGHEDTGYWKQRPGDRGIDGWMGGHERHRDSGIDGHGDRGTHGETCGFGDTWLPWGHMAWCKKQQECDHGVSPCGEPGTHGDSHVCAVQLRGRRRGRSCFYFALLVLSPPLPRERGQRWGQGGQGAALSCGEGTETCGTMGAEPCRAELCRAGCQPLFPSSSPVRGPAVRQRCPRGEGGGGGTEGPLFCVTAGRPRPRASMWPLFRTDPGYPR